MRASNLEPVAAPATNNNNINIDSLSTLRISLTITTSPCTIPQHRPILLPSGVVSTSPPYPRTKNAVPEFVPHRPTFLSAAALHASSVNDKGKGHRHAALIAHLRAELREDGGAFEDVVKDCRRGRGGYQRS
ncbi:hypothetical protein B5807_00735 [Epicoccum nigrum]|jgi:hypothetical protein|uniref:Uncharacterized protein n=1 Tax=Epicoccum nigrum TaxID=105696 RepID=A0A1Y2MHJ7_EPING|nr:hypothetical protein B5807_00735 [Epicoccum nigrum]